MEERLDANNGEDINSPVYGGINYHLIRDSFDYVESPTISVNYLEIGVDLENNTDFTFLIDQVTIEIVDLYSLQDLIISSGRWANIVHANNYFGSIPITIKNLSENAPYYPDQLILEPKGIYSDKRIQFVISIGDELQSEPDQIIAFKINLRLISLDSDRVENLTSDKIYYIAKK